MNEKNSQSTGISFKDDYEFNLNGKFNIFEVDIESGNRTSVLFEDNLVVSRARQILRDLMFNGSTDYIISKIKFGDKGHTGTDLITPNPPKLSDTALYETNSSLVFSKSTSKVTLDTNKVVYSVRLDKNEANLNGGRFPITEAGLFNNRNEMFARKTFPVITKTEDRIYDFEWTIIF
jgi:hypothetical protein